MENTHTISSYLIQKLHEYGTKHIFGVPGDYILGFYDEMIRSNMLKVVNTCDEQGAAFAADAYARVKGFGAVCITYCVGGLKVVNATAQAYAEKSPVAVISGAPGGKERTKNPLLHHVVREYDTQQKIFEHITVASTVLNNPDTARAEIDRVLSMAFRYKRPVYIELPRDMISTVVANVSDNLKGDNQERSDPVVLTEAVEEAMAMINASQKPAIVAGVEIQRFGLQDEMLQLIEKTGIPVVATILSKSVIRENYPYYLGLYEGAMGDDKVREAVESSDCLILLGALMTDIDFGMAVTPIDQSHTIYVTSEKLSIRHHNFENVGLQDFIRGLRSANIWRREPVRFRRYSNESASTFLSNIGKKITVQRLFLRLASFITANTIVIADVGDSLFGALDLVILRDTEFLAPAFYTSMGFAVPAAIGAQLADPKLRPLVIVGDGAFQMTGMEVSTAVRYQLNPIVIVLNNGGYGTERRLLDGPFNDLQQWDYKSIPGLVGGGRGYVINTEDEFDMALEAANQYSDGLCILDVRLDPNDGSAALKRLTDMLGKRLR
ncbi:MAG TPA: thiamine pyrophosphate-dependent enzyme [Candidatus Nitrosopolaris sp.]|nr:thiamine pyrophosphate-dependent enzyme [Candidatus Nitrosopolaris sp.]